MPEITKHDPSLRGKTCMGIYGNPGVGKTRLISGSKSPLIIHPPTDHLDAVDTAVAHTVVREHSDLQEIYEELRMIKPGRCPYDWVWLDSVSLYQDHDIDAIHADVVAANPHRKDTPVAMDEWSLESRETAQWFRHMVALAKDYELFNFGFTAHAMELPLPPDDRLMLMPVIRGKNMPSKISGYMNVLAYMEVKQEKTVLRTQSSDRYYAKDQYMAWPEGRVVTPTMAKIEKAIAAARPTSVAEQRRTRTRRRAAA